MFLTITSTRDPATDLGFLLHKHPARFQSFNVAFGQVHVGYPEATDERCTVAMVLDIDPIDLSRRRGRSKSLYEYVNDRPYVASSFLSVAIAKVFGSALKGRCEARPELVDRALPLDVEISTVACLDGAEFIRGLFEPLGYQVGVEQVPLDPNFPNWGPSATHVVALTGEVTVRNLLRHLYVLLPVLDDDKHYWVDQDEIDKLLRYGGEWLAGHPLRDQISHRYLKRRRHLSRNAIQRLEEESGGLVESEDPNAGERVVQPRLRDLRLDAVVQQLTSSGAASVVDLGCGQGALLERLRPVTQFSRVVAVDVSMRSLRRAKDRLRLDQLAPHHRDRFDFFQTSLVYADTRLLGFDAAALVEVVEHLDPWRLPTLERAVFGFARPGTIVLTTPNADYNVRFDDLPPGELRHDDHRFEWTRSDFREWADRVADEHGYTVVYVPVGDEDPEVGPATQMAVFSRADASAAGVVAQ